MVIDGDPIEAAAGVLFDAGHQFSDRGFQIAERDAVFGRNDEAKLMPVIFAALQEFLGAQLIAFPVI